jgi:hypothetical protein
MRRRLEELNWQIQPLNNGTSGEVLKGFDSRMAEVGARPSVSVKGQKQRRKKKSA